MKVKRQARLLQLTKEQLVVECKQQRLLRCQSCGGHTLIVIFSDSYQLRWCSQCVSQLTLTSFDHETNHPAKSLQDIKKWVDNGRVQLIETPEQTIIITF